MTTPKRVIPVLFACLCLLLPRLSQARDESPSLFSYGSEGFGTGALVGLAAGYLSTGDDYESSEWRKLVFGAGVGALVGVGTGLTLGVLDLGSQPPGAGWIVLRDTGRGTGLGAIVGLAVGALYVIDSNDPKDLLIGAAYGGIIGAGAGVVFGVIEAALIDRGPAPRESSSSAPRLRLTLTGVADSPLPLPTLMGTF
jgi:hypothetical protein